MQIVKDVLAATRHLLYTYTHTHKFAIYHDKFANLLRKHMIEYLSDLCFQSCMAL